MFKRKENTTTEQKKVRSKKPFMIVLLILVGFPLLTKIMLTAGDAIEESKYRATRETFVILSVVDESTVMVRSEKTGDEAPVRLFGITAPTDVLEETVVGRRVAFTIDGNYKADENGLAQPYMVDVSDEHILQIELLAKGTATRTIPKGAAFYDEYFEAEVLRSYGQ